MVAGGFAPLSQCGLTRPDIRWSSAPGRGPTRSNSSSARLANGTRVRLASGVYHIEDRRVVLRIAYSQEALWRELGEFGEVLLLGFPIAVLLAGFGGYALAR